MSNIKKILIADKSPLYRAGVKVVLNEGQSKLQLCEAGSVSKVLKQVQDQGDLDLIILDAALLQPGENCPIKSLILRISTPVLLLCNTLTSTVLSNVRSLGVQNVMFKTDSLSDLYHGIVTILAGGECWPDLPAVVESQQADIDDPRKLEECIGALTGAQQNVLNFLKKGMMNKEIGYQLGISENTVKSHVSKILCRLQVKNRTQLALVMHRSFMLERADQVSVMA